MSGFASKTAQTLRIAVRQLAASIYVYIAYGLFVGSVGAYGFALEAGLVLAAGLVLGKIIDGPRWTTGLVGLFVGCFDALIGFLSLDVPLDASLAAGLGLRFALLAVAGLAGAEVTRRRRPAPQPVAEIPPADSTP